MKTALVTGAATGIGAASARALAAKGFKVIGTDVDDARGVETFAALGEPHHYRSLDVRDAEAWKALIASVGTLDLLHLNAGVMTRPKGAPLMDNALDWLTTEGMGKVMSVNFDGNVHGIIAALDAPGLSQIIITASGAALFPLEMDPYYTASKYGILGLALSLEPSLAKRGIRIDVLCPGAIDTELCAPDIRVAMKQEPSSFIGECVATLATTAAHGPVWMAFSEEQGLQRYELPGLPGVSSALDLVEDI
jgi:NAD(P)-dependent dehydrogenase (short-subunit alcohol dehydrogenase family)